tara:strand:+ start:96 stop:263 length:168 start_codon:yes stop_codon:yes gene_type:complete
MDPHARDNWIKIKKALEAAGKTNCLFYKRAAHIAKGGEDLDIFHNDPEQKSEPGV